jgi:hypothetical protein
VLDKSNMYMAELPKSTDKKFVRMKTFNPISREEFDTLLGLFFHMGNVKFPKINDYWRTDILCKNEIFLMCMSRNRFLQILRGLHFADQEHPEDRLCKVRPLLDYFNQKVEELYEPNRYVSIDKSMILWRGKLIFRQ